MFTGIIEEIGSVRAVHTSAQGGRISVSARLVTSEVKLGESIAVNGVCLTVVEFSPNLLAFDVSAETMLRSTLGRLSVGSSVNLERALRVGDRLGGHIVQGHVDGRGQFVSRQRAGESVLMRFRFPPEIAQYICIKGSIAIDGISLTVANLGDDWFEIAVIPHTLKMTTLFSLKPADAVNLETDMLAKYLERLIQHGNPGNREKSGLTLEKLQDLGY
jgi:riboflavin synthase